jgi:hypothetical protein
MTKRVTSIILILVVIQLINPFISFAQSIPDSYRHRIHGWNPNYDNPDRDDYAFAHEHALQMGYSLVSIGKPEESKYDNLGLIKNFNAGGSGPIRIRLDDEDGDGVDEIKQFIYRDYYHLSFDEAEQEYISAFDATKYVNRWYDITDQAIIDLLKTHGCAKESADLSQLTLDNINKVLIMNLFHYSWVKANGEFSIRPNWQSVDVVSDLVNKTIDSINHDSVDAIFFDYFNIGPNNCSNANYNESATYVDWYEGQREYIGQVNSRVKQMSNSHGNPYYVMANVGNPKTGGAKAAQFYADATLRIDEYIFETNTVRDSSSREIIIENDANAIDPETGKPAFIPLDTNTWEPLYDNPSDAYLPADKVSLNVGVNFISGPECWYGSLGVLSCPYREDDYFDDSQCDPHPNEDDYFTQTIKSSGIAANQGSWFGYYGNIAKKDNYECVNGIPQLKNDEEKEWVKTNDLQLLHAIPNWDNLLGIPVPEFGNPRPDDERKWDPINLIYKSPNSYASPDVIYSRHFQTGELFLAFMSLIGEVILKPSEQVISAEFADRYFARNGEDALPCLDINSNTIKLKPECGSNLGKGVRISNQPSEQRIVSYWNLDEGSGNTAYDSIANNDGSISGATWSSGIRDNALDFDGTNDYISMGDARNLDFFDGDDFSISAWFKRNTFNTDDIIVSKRNAFVYSSRGYALQIDSTDEIVFEVCDKITDDNSDVYSITSSIKITDNDWHHVAVIFDEDADAKLYIDGLEALGNLNRPFSGLIDEVRVFNEVLSDEEVSKLYDEFTRIDGDANDDGFVDGLDYIIWLNHFGQSTPNGHKDGDFDGNGTVGSEDYTIWLNNYGT